MDLLIQKNHGGREESNGKARKIAKKAEKVFHWIIHYLKRVYIAILFCSNIVDLEIIVFI
jgi:hypothetical protein